MQMFAVQLMFVKRICWRIGDYYEGCHYVHHQQLRKDVIFDRIE